MESKKSKMKTITLRLPVELHKQIAMQAKLAGKSMNTWILEKINIYLTKPE